MKLLLLLIINILPVKYAFTQTYIINVSILDVEKQQLIPAQTVVITGNTITAIASSTKIIPVKGAPVIDGKGKFLMPGMTDAHVHFFQSGGLYTRPDAIDLRKYIPYEKEIAWVHQNMEDQLRRYLRNGITTVIDVGATLNFLQQRDSFRNKVYAPDIYMTGPLITTWEPPEFKGLKNDEPFYEISTAEEARAMVKKQLPYKPAFIKIWFIAALGNDVEATAKKYLPLIQATIAEAHKNNLRVAVHATERITAKLAAESGCDYLVHGVADEIVNDSFLQLLKNKHIILCPTLIVGGNYSKVFAQQTACNYIDFTRANPVQLGSLYDLKHLPDTNLVKTYKAGGEQEVMLLKNSDSIQMLNLKKMMDAGITIASGTDAGNIGTLHASSYLEELKAMKHAGMSNWQVITASTINGAKAAGKQKEWGSIAVGKKANMVLLDANPVDNLDNLQSIELVINKGYLIKPDTLIKETPESLVNRQLNAYNALNLEAFLEPYADDVELYDFPDTLVCKGKEAMRKMYAWLDKVPNLHCEITGRVIQGNIVTDNEKITGAGDKPIEAITVYHIENNKIKKVYFK